MPTGKVLCYACQRLACKSLRHDSHTPELSRDKKPHKKTVSAIPCREVRLTELRDCGVPECAIHLQASDVKPGDVTADTMGKFHAR